MSDDRVELDQDDKERVLRLLAKLKASASTEMTAAEIRAQKRSWIRSIGGVTDEDIIRVLPELAPKGSLSDFTDGELRTELGRRDRERIDAYWEERKRTAKYLCPDCGMPNSSHTTDCPSDMDCT